MLSYEERKAIENLKIEYEKLMKEDNILFPLYKSNAKRLIDIIEKQSKEIEHQIEKRANQRNELAILNAKQIEFNKLVNTVNSYKGQFKRQQKELEELKEDSCCMTTCLRRDKEKLFLEDKIKSKIEELEKEQEDNRKNLYNAVNNLCFKEIDKISDKIYVNMSERDILQSLLEKE